MTEYNECPRCGIAYPKYLAALSRRDNKTHICHYCGPAEALEAAGLMEPYEGEVYWEKEEGNEEVHIATDGEADTK